MPLTIPAPVDFTDVEETWADLEPPGIFTPDQDSWHGQRRKVVTDILQGIVDDFSAWYYNINPNTVDANDLANWEVMLGVPASASNKTVDQRRAFVVSRWKRGPFTRARRAAVVESFIQATFGTPIQFTSSGVPFDSGGMTFADEAVPLSGAYNIVENIPAFSYDVRILNTISVDTVGLERELTRITPAGITFTITLTATP